MYIYIYLKQVLVATPHETPAVWPPAHYHENYSSEMKETYRTLLEKQERTQKQDDQHEHTFTRY